MSELIIIRGLSGTGKSTMAREKFVPLGYVHLENDMYFKGRGDTTGKGNLEEFVPDDGHWARAKHWCKQRVMDAMLEKRNIVLANCFTQHWQYEAYLNLAMAMGYTVRVIPLTKIWNNHRHLSKAYYAHQSEIWED